MGGGWRIVAGFSYSTPYARAREAINGKMCHFAPPATRIDVLALWAEVTKRKPGAPEGNKNSAKGDAPENETNVDNVNSCSPERPTGNTAAAGLRKLQKAARPARQ